MNASLSSLFGRKTSGEKTPGLKSLSILKREMCPFSAKGSFNRNRRWEYLELSTVPIDDCLC